MWTTRNLLSYFGTVVQTRKLQIGGLKLPDITTFLDVAAVENKGDSSYEFGADGRERGQMRVFTPIRLTVARLLLLFTFFYLSLSNGDHDLCGTVCFLLLVRPVVDRCPNIFSF